MGLKQILTMKDSIIAPIFVSLTDIKRNNKASFPHLLSLRKCVCHLVPRCSKVFTHLLYIKKGIKSDARNSICK